VGDGKEMTKKRIKTEIWKNQLNEDEKIVFTIGMERNRNMINKHSK
jgi:hypothetical protein